MGRISIVLRFCAVAVVVATTSCSETSYVDAVTISNPTHYPANVSVRGGADDGWLLLGTVVAGDDKTVTSVVDQGSTWIFRFDHSGRAEEVEVSRGDLESGGWTVEVPAAFDDVRG